MPEKAYEKHAWISFLAPGIWYLVSSVAGFALAAGVDPHHWDWLTSDPNVISYLKLHFGNAALPPMGLGVFTIAISITACRRAKDGPGMRSGSCP